jgi:regulator of RNase E activity RraB
MDKYTLYTTAEECNEVSQALMKVLRFGIGRINPKDGVTNRKQLEDEIGQLQYCLDRTIKELDLNNSLIDQSYRNKKETWETWKEYYVS